MRYAEIANAISEDTRMTEGGHEDWWNMQDAERSEFVGKVQDKDLSVGEAAEMVSMLARKFDVSREA